VVLLFGQVSSSVDGGGFKLLTEVRPWNINDDYLEGISITKEFAVVLVTKLVLDGDAKDLYWPNFLL